jgi:iron(III) transport system permease protein
VVAGVVVALLLVAPLLALPASFLGEGDAFGQIASSLLPSALKNSAYLALGVGVGTLALGAGLAMLVSFYEFPGRRILDWALVLPLAVPGFVLVFVVLGQFDTATPFQSSLFGQGLRIPGIRSPLGAVVILTAVLYPYVYVLGRSAFLGQSRRTIEAARSLGLSYGQAVRRVAFPLARPALAGGVALAVMEALADFGTVDLLGVQALTSAIYRVWNGAFDEAAALQLASVLLTFTFVLLAAERLLRGRARYDQLLGEGDAIQPRPLRGWSRWLVAGVCWLLLAVVFLLPVVQLVAWSLETISEGSVAPSLGKAAMNTALLGVITAVVAVGVGTLLVFAGRSARSRTTRGVTRASTLGYAVPGAVVAVAVYVPLVWLDRRLISGADSVTGSRIGLVFTGTILGLVIAYLVRFNALSFLAVDSRMSRIGPELDDAARALGADRARILADVHLPLLKPGMIAGGLLVLVEVMKELPATALLRPLGHDTLAITVWEATKDSRLAAAALPALLIVLVGLLPVVLLVRLLRAEGWDAAAQQL